MTNSLQVVGTKSLIDMLVKIASLDDVKKIVRVNTFELNRNTVINAVYTGKYTTGATRRSIRSELEPFVGKVRMGTHYAVYLEEGTYKMSPQPALRPAFNIQKQKFLDDLSRVMK